MLLIDQSTFAALKEMSGEDLINALIDAFLEDAPKMITAMQAGLDTRNVDSVRRNAHSIKSNADIFGATALAAMAREVETMARAGDLDLGTRIEVLRVACASASKELEGMRT